MMIAQRIDSAKDGFVFHTTTEEITSFPSVRILNGGMCIVNNESEFSLVVGKEMEQKPVSP